MKSFILALILFAAVAAKAEPWGTLVADPMPVEVTNFIVNIDGVLYDSAPIDGRDLHFDVMTGMLTPGENYASAAAQDQYSQSAFCNCIYFWFGIPCSPTGLHRVHINGQWILTSDNQSCGVETYVINLNGNNYISATKLSADGKKTCIWFLLDGLVVPGINTVVALAENIDGESAPSSPFVFWDGVLGYPGGLRIIHTD